VTVNLWSFRVWPLLMVLAVINGAAGENPEPRIYSNVRYIEEGAGDLVGTELELKIEGSQATGVLRIYEGGCATPRVARGSLVHGKLRLTGENEVYGKFEVSGIIHEDTLKGLLVLEKAIGPEKIRLKKIAKPHC
jgi:hypothetical protein